MLYKVTKLSFLSLVVAGPPTATYTIPEALTMETTCADMKMHHREQKCCQKPSSDSVCSMSKDSYFDHECCNNDASVSLSRMNCPESYRFDWNALLTEEQKTQMQHDSTTIMGTHLFFGSFLIDTSLAMSGQSYESAPFFLNNTIEANAEHGMARDVAIRNLDHTLAQKEATTFPHWDVLGKKTFVVFNLEVEDFVYDENNQPKIRQPLKSRDHTDAYTLYNQQPSLVGNPKMMSFLDFGDYKYLYYSPEQHKFRSNIDFLWKVTGEHWYPRHKLDLVTDPSKFVGSNEYIWRYSQNYTWSEQAEGGVLVLDVEFDTDFPRVTDTPTTVTFNKTFYQASNDDGYMWAPPPIGKDPPNRTAMLADDGMMYNEASYRWGKDARQFIEHPNAAAGSKFDKQRVVLECYDDAMTNCNMIESWGSAAMFKNPPGNKLLQNQCGFYPEKLIGYTKRTDFAYAAIDNRRTLNSEYGPSPSYGTSASASFKKEYANALWGTLIDTNKLDSCIQDDISFAIQRALELKGEELEIPSPQTVFYTPENKFSEDATVFDTSEEFIEYAKRNPCECASPTKSMCMLLVTGEDSFGCGSESYTIGDKVYKFFDTSTRCTDNCVPFYNDDPHGWCYVIGGDLCTEEEWQKAGYTAPYVMAKSNWAFGGFFLPVELSECGMIPSTASPPSHPPSPPLACQEGEFQYELTAYIEKTAYQAEVYIVDPALTFSSVYLHLKRGFLQLDQEQTYGFCAPAQFASVQLDGNTNGWTDEGNQIGWFKISYNGTDLLYVDDFNFGVYSVDIVDLNAKRSGGRAVTHVTKPALPESINL